MCSVVYQKVLVKTVIMSLLGKITYSIFFCFTHCIVWFIRCDIFPSYHKCQFFHEAATRQKPLTFSFWTWLCKHTQWFENEMLINCKIKQTLPRLRKNNFYPQSEPIFFLLLLFIIRDNQTPYWLILFYIVELNCVRRS